MSIKQIYFREDLSDYENIDQDFSEGQFIDDIKKVNLLIGPNNSGKSRMMRTLFWGNYIAIFGNNSAHQFQKVAKDLLQLLDLHNVVSVDGYKAIGLRGLDRGVPLKFESNASTTFKDFFNKVPLQIAITSAVEKSEESNLVSLGPFVREWNKLMPQLNDMFKVIHNQMTKNNSGGVYIPILRGTRPLGENSSTSKDIFAERSRRDYFNKMNDSQKDDIVGGYNMYKEVENLLLGDINERTLIGEYEKFLAEHFFHQKVVIIPKRGEDVLLVTIGDEEERLIYDLGDGVQAIILLTFPIFMRKDNECTFYIEEPELNLHPSLQRKFLRCLSMSFPKHQYFLSTHSNHFLEAISEYEDVSIYSFKKAFKQNCFHVQKLNSIKTDVLDNLGVRNSSVLMANCTIWVEGITDRLYLSKYLEIYSKHRAHQVKQAFSSFKEDQHYSFVEYAGSNIVHWTFNDQPDENINASYISNNILLIADSDHDPKGNVTSAKKKRFDSLKSSLGKNFVLIDGKEIENILHSQVILKVIADYEGKEIDKIAYNNSGLIPKNKNLGKWINESVDDLSRDYSRESTISDKLNFCKKSLKYINSYDDMTKEARNLCQKIYSFIRECNSDYIEI